MELYFDNAAAMPIHPDSLAEVRMGASLFYANQEAMGAHALEARRVISEASDAMCTTLCGSRNDSSVLWVNTGTDAIRGGVECVKLLFPNGGRILCTDGEHGAMLAALESLPAAFPVTKVRLRRDGTVDLDHLRECLTADVVLLATHHVQPETGVIQDLGAIRALLDSCGSKALLFADTIQSVGKLPIPWRQARLDMMTLSGQKLGALSGAALIVRTDTKYALARQARRVRSELHAVGRVVPVLILNTAERVQTLCAAMDSNRDYVAGLKRQFLEELASVSDLKIRCSVDQKLTSPYILHLLLDSCQGAVISRSLAANGISVAPGSACSAETSTPSKVLTAMGLKSRAFEALRISFSPDHTPEEVSLLVEALIRAIRAY